MAPTLTRTLQTLFADLVQQVFSAPRAGTPYVHVRDGVEYLYAKIRVGTDRTDLFLGRAADPAIQGQVEALKRGMALARSRRATVSLLKRAGFAGPDRILGATLDSLAFSGLFREGAVLIGTSAYMMSEALVGAFLPEPTLMTGDIDLATADLALSAEPPEALHKILRRADPTYEPVMQLDGRKPASRFRNGGGFLVDLITPTRRKSDTNPLPLRHLDAGAAPLQHIDWLISNPVPTVALWGAGVPIAIPQPARYAVHKLILAQRRDAANSIKRQKDLAQARALIKALQASDTFALEDVLEEARSKGKKGWAEPIGRSLRELELDL